MARIAELESVVSKKWKKEDNFMTIGRFDEHDGTFNG